MTRLLLLSTLAGIALTVAVAWPFRSELAYAAEPVPEPRETQADVIRAAVFACVDAGGTWSQGVEDGVLLGRCYPLPSVGVVQVVRAVRR